MDIKKIINSNAFLIVFSLAFFLIIRLGFNFNGVYGQDSHEYLRYGKALYQFFLTGKHPGDYVWPVNYPLYGALLSLLLRNVGFSMQILSVCSFIGILIYSKKILQLFFFSEKEKISLFLLCFLFFSPLILRASFLIMSDILCMFFIIGSFYHFYQFQKNGYPLDLSLLVFFSFSAVMTRYTAAIILLIPGIITSIKLIREKKFPQFFFSGCIGAFVLLPHFLIKANNSTSFIHHEFFTDWSPVNFLKSGFITLGGGSERYRFPNFIYSFYNIIHPGYFFMGVFLLLFLKKKHFQSDSIKVAGLTVLLYAVFLSGIPYQNLRYVMLTFPLVLICLYPAYLSFYNFLSERKLSSLGTAIIIITQITLFSYVFNIVYQRNQFERDVFTALDNYPENVLYTFDIDVALMSYETKHHVINLLTKDIRFKNGELILFNEQRFGPQWGHTNLGSNWSNLKSTHQLIQLKELKDGWKLYEIQ